MRATSSLDASRVAVIWSRFGPYHLARLEAAGKFFEQKGVVVYGLEVALTDREYQWQAVGGSSNFRRLTLFERSDYKDLGRRQIAAAVTEALDRIRPGAVAIPGWVLPEARAALRWCKGNSCAAVLMSDSKRDDLPRMRIKEWVKKQIVRRFDAALVAGGPQRDYAAALGIQRDRILLGYDVVDNEYFQRRAGAVRGRKEQWRARLDLPPRFFLTCCRFREEKNLPRLLEAYGRYRESCDTPWDLVICGDGTLGPQLRAHARDLDLEGVIWPGFVQFDDLPAYYGLASAFILASTKETWGLVVNEAMASGLPVLVSSRAGCRYDLVRDGVNGYVFDPYDIAAMADKMLRVFRLSEEQRKAMGQASRDTIAHWGPDLFAEALWRAVRTARRRREGVESVGRRLVFGVLTYPLLCPKKK